ncbi:MAG: hypothetical protein AB7G12_16460 [Thermoanaerobaculia bacterium]
MSPSESKTQTAAERREAEAELRALVARYAPEQARLFGAVRRWLQKRLPTAHELVYEYRDNFVISYAPDDRGYEGVLALRASADGIKLYLTAGKGLADPEKLLRGSGTQARWLAVESASVLARPAVAGLIDAAIARQSAAFAASGRGPVVIRSTAAKKRRQ